VLARAVPVSAVPPGAVPLGAAAATTATQTAAASLTGRRAGITGRPALRIPAPPSITLSSQ
jgi:hypothetical protein